jgi:F-type H+-transporting ATPase subunit alpha
MKKVAGSLRLDLAQYRGLAAFAQFGSDLDDATRRQLTRGERMVELLKQGQYVPMAVEDQVIVIWAGSNGFLDPLPVAAVKKYESEFLAFVHKDYPDVALTIKSKGQLTPEIEPKLKEACTRFSGMFKP